MYITAQQIYSKIPEKIVNDALDDDKDGQADPGALDQLIANSCQAVDALLAGRFPVPFQAPYPPAASQAALMFACEEIYGRREVTGDKNPFKAQADTYRGTVGQKGLLILIANRELPLDASEKAAFTPGAVIHEEAPVNASFR